MSHHIIEVTDLAFTYPDGTTALSGVSFRVTHGESVAIVGNNGAGKSTLLEHLNGYHIPKVGSVTIGDMTINAKNLQEIRKTVGMVFQNPDDQLFLPTVRDDVAFGPLNLGLSVNAVEKRVERALDAVGAGHLVDKQPHRLSGGEKRAVAIATVLAMEPDILVMDEPSSSLDPGTRRELIRLLARFSHTKIIATHDLDLALDLCERTIVLHQGQIIVDGNTREIFQSEEILKKSRLEKPLGMQGCPICSAKSTRENRYYFHTC